MIDNFSLGLTHLLMLYAAWRLLFRPDLDREETIDETTVTNQAPRSRWGRK